jgi:WD40 repeat protein
MLPENRLFNILHNTFDLQAKACKFHTIKEPRSLYMDHSCPREDFPDTLALSLEDLGNEVWNVEFSHDGKRLAACGKANMVLIWDVPSFQLVFTLKGHRDAVTNISWSPDDSKMVTCSFDKRARLWNMTDGTLLNSLDPFDEPVTGCVWYTDSRAFTISSFDKHRGLRTYTTYGSGGVAHEWKADVRVQNVAASSDGRWLITVDHTSLVHVWDAQTRESLFTHHLPSRPTSIVVSNDNVHLLVNCRDGCAHLLNLETRQMTQTFTGHVGGKYQISASFGGPDEDYVVCGSEDGQVFLWQRHTGELVLKLVAHKPICNAIAWNPSDPCMFATCGDDGLVKIWTNKARAEKTKRLPPPRSIFGSSLHMDPFAAAQTLA